MIREAKSLLLGEYGKLFERDSFKTILLADRGDSEAVCRERHGMLTDSQGIVWN